MDTSLLSAIGLDSFVSIDVETTGLDFKNDKIIEVSACKYINGQLNDTFSSLVNPGVSISPFITKLTGINNSDLFDKPSFNEISSEFIEFIKDQPLIGHNVTFDINFINKELNQKYVINNQTHISDTYYLSKVFLFYSESFKLSSLCEQFNIDLGTIHRAEQDAQNTAKLFLEIIKIIIKTDVNILSKINRCMKNIHVLNKELLMSIVSYLLSRDLLEKEKFYDDKVLASFLFENNAENIFLDKNVEDYLNKNGVLSKKINRYEVRKNQIDFTNDCSNIINKEGILIAEADTGIGKTFSYLLSSLMHIKNKKILISTSTHSLQEQIFIKDLPQLSKVLDVKVYATIVKGMNNYLCKHRLENVIDQIDSFLNENDILEFLSIVLWSEVTNTGDVSECNSFKYKTNYKIWDLVKYENEDCPLRTHHKHDNCFYKKMIESAKKSNILIINHALLGSSFIYKHEDFINNSICIVDEAHKFIENFRGQLKQSISFNSIQLIINNLATTFNKIAIQLLESNQQNINKSIMEIKNDLESFNKDYNTFLNEFCPKLLEDKRSDLSRKIDIKFIYSKNTYNDLVIKPEELSSHFNLLIEKITKLYNDKLRNSIINKAEKINIKITINKCNDFQQIFRQLFDEENDNINWTSMNVYRGNISSISLHSTPFFIHKQINELINKFDANIYCSATLTINNDFEYFINELGVDSFSNNKEIIFKKYSSNFYLNDQIKSFVLNTNYDINSFEYLEKVFKIILNIKQNIKKRMLVLCTSYKQIQTLRDISDKHSSKLEDNFLFQDSTSSRQVLLNKYLNQSNTVLIGTNTFWEGLDLPNEKLEILLIVKIPFSNPYNPIVKSKIDYLSNLGMNSFLDYQLPESILKLKQGIGRLIRSQNDMGVCILTDPRILNKRYGKVILDNLDLNPISFSYEDTLVNESKKFLGSS